MFIVFPFSHYGLVVVSVPHLFHNDEIRKTKVYINRITEIVYHDIL